MTDFFDFIIMTIEAFIAFLALVLWILVGIVTIPIWIIPYLIYKEVSKR